MRGSSAKKRNGLIVLVVLLTLGGGHLQAAIIVAGDPFNLRQRTTTSTTYTTDDNGPYSVGTSYFVDGTIRDENNILIPFDLSGVGTITDGTFFSQADNVFSSPLTYNIDLYGIGYSADLDTFPDTPANMFYLGPSDGTATPIQYDYLSQPVTENSYTGTSVGAKAALIAYLNARPEGMDIVWFRLNADASVGYTGPTGNENYTVRFDPTGVPPWDGLSDGVPYLDITVVPEPGTSLLLALGLGGVLLPRRRR